jgi:hypothetical protein
MVGGATMKMLELRSARRIGDEVLLALGWKDRDILMLRLTLEQATAMLDDLDRALTHCIDDFDEEGCDVLEVSLQERLLPGVRETIEREQL